MPQHVSDGLSRLKHQRVGKKVIEGLLTSYLQPIQGIANQAEVYKNLSIRNATGEDLDLYGRLYNVTRDNRDDESYRSVILGYIAATQPDASPEGLMGSLRSYGQTEFVDLHEHFPCYTQMYMGEGFGFDMYTVLKTLCPVGTDIGLYVDDRGDSIVLSEDIPETFYFITDQDKFLDIEAPPENPRVLSLDRFNEVFSQQDNSVFAEELDTEWSPLAEQMDFGVSYTRGRIVDENNDFIVDEFGDNITYVEFQFNPK